MNTKALNYTTTAQEQNESIDRANAKQQMIAVACLSFFPMIYLIGKAVMTWMS